MQPGAVDLVVDADFGAVGVDEGVERAGIGGTEISGGDDPQLDIAALQLGEFVFKQPHPLLLDERAQQIHLIRTRQLGA
ncbi:MAG: hypothetical protein QG671_186 [Actinomycetota bacterium]|nr:hypothetical protein [Actinomycetota bacterium]